MANHIIRQVIKQRGETVFEADAWCGKKTGVLYSEFWFVDAEHAKRSLDGSVSMCQTCWHAAVKAGAVTLPDKPLTVDTWALVT